MIPGFEKETHDLTEAEKKLLPMFVAGFIGKVGKENAVTNKQIIERLKQRNVIVSEARVRKLVNHIRNRGLVEGLKATSAGYYVSNDIKEIEDYVLSLQGREDAIRIVKEGFEAYLIRLKINTHDRDMGRR